MFPVSLNNFHFENWNFTVSLASGITAADVGKALAFDSSANTMKLAGDGDIIEARLEQVENRVQEGQLVGTASFKFGAGLPIKSGETVNVGDRLIGAGSGEVKAITTPTGHERVLVTEVSGSTAIALAM